MQTLRDAVILLGVLLLVASVRVTRLAPGGGSLGLVPAVQAAAAPGATPSEPAPDLTPIELHVVQPALENVSVPATLEGEIHSACQTQVYRFVTTAERQRDVIAIAVETAKAKARPRACKVG